MLDTLFGAEMPLAVRFFLAFLIVLGLIGATAWAVRRFGTGRLGSATSRGRQPRLAVIDYASVDGRRRLILVRRDNVEHLLMIGGPTDVVVEPNIVRATAASRVEVPAARPTAGIDALPRAIPLPENGNGSGLGSWPLQPEPAGGPRSSPRLEPLPDELSRPFQPLHESPPPAPPAPPPPPRPQRDTLAALAEELSVRSPSPLRGRPGSPPGARPQSDEPHQEARKPSAQPASPITPAAAPVAPAAAETGSPDQSLADMAQRLEAALRKSAPELRPPATPARPAPPAPPAPPEQAASAEPPRMPQPRPPRGEPKPAQGKSTLYDSLEQEMASLLGRPTKP